MLFHQLMVLTPFPPLLAQVGPNTEDSPTGSEGQNALDIVNNLISQVLQDSRNFVYALLIFILGWIIAKAVEGLTQGFLRKTSLEDKLSEWIGEEYPVTAWTGTTVFWLIFLFGIVAALQRLQLDAVTQPLNTLLNQITNFLPQIGAAVVVLGLVAVIAKVVKLITSRVLQAFNIDQRFGEQAGTTDSELSLTNTISNTLYWLIFLLFLPSILSILQLEGTLVPVQDLVNQILQIVPNLFAAALILFIGWFVAQIIRKIVTNLLASSGIDNLGSRFGLSGAGDIQSLSWIIGTVVYVLVLIPVLISGLDELGIQAISEPAVAMLDQILNTLPSIFVATLILIISYLLGQYVKDFVTNFLTNVGFNNVSYWLGLQQTLTTETGNQEESAQSLTPRRTPSELVGIIVLVGIILFGAWAAVDILNIDSLTALFDGIVFVSGRIIAGLVVFAIGLYLANVAFNFIVSANMQPSRTLAQAARIIIITFSVAFGLNLIGIAPNLVNLAFGLLFGSVAVAIALAFGLGAREIAAEQVREWVNSFKSSRNN